MRYWIKINEDTEHYIIKTEHETRNTLITGKKCNLNMNSRLHSEYTRTHDNKQDVL
jgi:hypothetical protein